jgi:hypothetical protein
MLEEREGSKIVQVELTVMDDSLIIEPVFEGKEDRLL